MNEITKVQKSKAVYCSFAGCEICSGQDIYIITIGTKKLPFCHDCAKRIGELFGVNITNEEILK